MSNYVFVLKNTNSAILFKVVMQTEFKIAVFSVIVIWSLVC